MAKTITETKWRIWSNEHGRWWNPNRAGYTKNRKNAGLYSYKEAIEICASANARLTDEQEPLETMLLA